MEYDHRLLRLRQIQHHKQIAELVLRTALFFAVGFIVSAVVSAGAVLSLAAAFFLAAALGSVILYAHLAWRDLDIEERWLRRQL